MTTTGILDGDWLKYSNIKGPVCRFTLLISAAFASPSPSSQSKSVSTPKVYFVHSGLNMADSATSRGVCRFKRLF